MEIWEIMPADTDGRRDVVDSYSSILKCNDTHKLLYVYLIIINFSTRTMYDVSYYDECYYHMTMSENQSAFAIML